MLLAFEPSRETPHSWRSSSRGTIFPWYPMIIASAAAPHSTASIWRTVGHFARLFGGVGFGGSGGAGGAGTAGSADMPCQTPRDFLTMGSTYAIGRFLSTTTEPFASVPLKTAAG